MWVNGTSVSLPSIMISRSRCDFSLSSRPSFRTSSESINWVDALQSIMAVVLDMMVVNEVPILISITIGSLHPRS